VNGVAVPVQRHGTRGARRFRVLDAFLLECLSLAAPISADIGGRGGGSSMLAATYGSTSS